MSWDWDRIEQQPGFAGACARADAEIRPILEKVETDPIDPERQKKVAGSYVTGGFFAFIVMFMTAEFLIPNGGAWEVLTFLLFPVLFILNLAAALFLMRGRLMRMFAEAQARLGLRAEALRRIAAPLGLTYVPAPGGAPKGLDWLARQSWAPQAIREAAVALNAAGGMDETIAVVRDSGLFTESNVYVVGTPEQKKLYAEQAAGMRQMEDGFEGTRGGCAFSMFEWAEKVEDSPDVYHLMIILEAPFQLHGVTQLRARKTSWPQDPGGNPMQEVDLGPKAFDALYRLRASDQVEARAIFNPAVIERVIALAHGGRFRAVGRAQHLVFDFASETNRFHLVDLITGKWNDETILQTHADVAEALALVDALAHAFMLARKSDTSAP